MEKCVKCGKQIPEGYVYIDIYRCETCHRNFCEPLIEDYYLNGNFEHEWMLKCFGFVAPVDEEEQDEIDNQDDFYWTEFDEDEE